MIMAVIVIVVMVYAGPRRCGGHGLGRGQDEPAGLDAFCSDQIVGQLADLPRGAAEHDHLQATVGVEVDVVVVTTRSR